MKIHNTTKKVSLAALGTAWLAALVVVASVNVKAAPNQETAVFPPSTGLLPSHTISAASNNSTLIAAGPRQMLAYSAINTNATTAYLKFFDKATAPTCGTDVPVLVEQLAQNQPKKVGNWSGLQFKLGLGICIVGAIADTDNTNATTGISVDVAYR